MIPCYDSAMLSHIEKSIKYASEPDRLRKNGRGWMLKGNHGEHYVISENDGSRCDCNFYADRGICCHPMALERLGMISLVKPARAALC